MTQLYGDAIYAGHTSRQAYESIKPSLNRLERIVMEHLLIFGPSTCDEIESRLGMLHTTTSARLTALRDRGAIFDSGARRPTRSGRKACVWALR